MKTKLTSAFVLIAALALCLTALPARAQTGWGAALSFDGVDDYVRVPDAPALRLTNRFTLEFWFMPASLSQGQKYLLSHNGSDGSLQSAVIFGYAATNQVEFVAAGFSGANPRPGSAITLPDAGWHHLAYSYDGTNWAGYLDGVQKFSTSRNFGLNPAAYDWFIGAANTTQARVAGVFDEVRIWNAGRSATQIQANLLQPLTGAETNLVAYYRFDEAGGTTAFDATTNHFDASLANGPTWVLSTFCSLGTTNLLEGPAPGADSVVLAVNSPLAPWTATANDSWLHLSAANQSGTGGTNVVFTFEANPGVTRTGTLTIAGLTLTVTQAGASYVAANPVTTLVGSGLTHPSRVAVDGAGNVYIADSWNHAIKQWTAANQSVTTLVGSGLNSPFGVAVDGAGNVYIADTYNHAIKQWTAANQSVTTLVGSGLLVPHGVAVDGAGNVYIADTGNHAIKQWTAASQSVTTLVGSGLGAPRGVAVDGAGNVYIADTFNNAIKEVPRAFVDPTARVETAAAGSDTLPVVLPATQNLRAPFAPASDAPWLTISGVTNGVVSFAFTATATNRTAHITLLGQTIAVTQSAPATPPVFAGCTVSAPGQLKLCVTGTAGLTYTLQTSTNLVEWVDHTNLVADPDGLIEYTEDMEGDAPACFYRLRHQPLPPPPLELPKKKPPLGLLLPAEMGVKAD